MNKYEEIKQKVAELEADATAFYNKGNKAASVRLRKGLQDIKTLAKDARDEVTAIKNSEK